MEDADDVDARSSKSQIDERSPCVEGVLGDNLARIHYPGWPPNIRCAALISHMTSP